MKKYGFQLLIVAICAACLIVAIPGSVFAGGDTVKITGKVNDNFQVVTDDGEIFEIEETTKGNELIELVGSQVEVEGTINDEDGISFLTVTDYKVISNGS